MAAKKKSRAVERKANRAALKVKKAPRKKSKAAPRGPKVDLIMLDDVERLMAMCVSTAKIVEHCSKTHKRVERTTYSYMARIRESWIEKRSINKEGRLAKRVATAEEILKQSMAAKDFGNANRALKTLCELDGLIGPGVQVNIQNNTSITNVRGMTRQQRRKRIDELLALRGEVIDVESTTEH